MNDNFERGRNQQTQKNRYYLDAVDELQVAQVSDSNEGLKMGKDEKSFSGWPL